MYIYMLLVICGLTTTASQSSSNNGLWALFGNFINATHSQYVPEDARLNITQLGIKYGHPIEEHQVTTADGYIIHMHRMHAQNPGNRRPVVFLMHGILESSDCWLLMGPGKGLAFVLSNSGFDVWMGNARGNKHVLNHVALTNSMPKFWDFSWEEIALYDLPAMIDYVLKETRQQSLYYIGHSQGTTIGYVMTSMKPEYNKKIGLMVSLAPEAWMGNIRSPVIKMFAPTYNILGHILHGLNQYSASIGVFNKISALVCSIMPDRCDNILYALSGHETKINDTFLSVILGHTPTGASSRQFVHYGQLVQSNRFCRFDYSYGLNFIKYEQGTPPDYDLSEVITPVVIFYSAKDWLSDPKDVETLINHLPNVIFNVFLEDFTHIDYIYADDAVDKIYNKIIGLIYKFEEGPPPNNGNLQSEATVWC